MSKSKYPNKIDTSTELPVAKDNILQVGSKAINSLRSAIIQIEKTLGINPQGYEGNTVSERLNMSLDDYGFLKDDAIDKLNLLKGPVSNTNVASEAGIEETKLDLDFSTNFLYNQINSLFRDLETFSSEIKDIGSKLSLHLNLASLNSHIAKNISVKSFVKSTNSLATQSLSADIDLQTFIEALYSSHINYTGANISSDNSSHTANQIFYDNTTENNLTSNDVQGAIDELSSANYNLDEDHQKNFHSNGILKVLSKNKKLLITNQQVTFSQYSATTSEAGTRISFSTPVADVDLQKSDIIEITTNNIVSHFTYKSKILNSSSKIESIDIYEDIYFDSNSSTLSGYNNTDVRVEKAGLLMSSFEAATGTNASKMVVINPKSTYLVSERISPDLITSSNQNFIITVDNIDYTINCYSTGVQTIDSIIANINNKLSGLNASAIAFRVEGEYSKIGISHLVENSSSFVGKLKIKQGSDNSYSALGFASILDKEFSDSSNYFYYIAGSKKEGLKPKLITSSFEISTAAKTLTFSSSTSLKTYGIKKGDLISISGSSSDDGTYSIASVTDFELTIDSNNNFTGQTQSDSIKFNIYNNCIDVRDLAFESLSGSNKASLVEFYLNNDKCPLKTNILEYSPPVSSSNKSLVQIVNIKNNFNYNGQFIISKDSDDYLYIENDNGIITKLPDDDSFYFNLNNELNNIKLKIFIEDSSSLKTYIQSNGSQTIAYFAKKSLNEYDKIILGSCLYENFRGRFAGSDHIRFNSGKNFGMINEKDISDIFIKEYFNNFDYKTRSNGILSGCKVFDESIATGNYSFKVTSGECLVGGKRININYSEINTSISNLNDRLYVAVDAYGNIVYSVPNATCDLPFNLNNYAILAVINKGASGLINYDFRLFLSKIDEKVLNEILVSPVDGVGHFSKLSDAVKYARMIRKLSENYGSPIIKLSSGIFKETVTHQSVTEANYLTQDAYNNIYKDGIWIDFPVTIEGSGSETVLDLTNIWSDTSAAETKITDQTLKGAIYIAGNEIGTTKPTYGLSSALDGGDVIIKNLKLKQSRIYLIDQLAERSSVQKKEFVRLNSLIFEEDSSVFDQKSFYYVKEDVTLDSTNKFGNLTVSGCKFINSGMSYDSDSDLYIDRASYIDNVFLRYLSGAINNYAFEFVNGSTNPIRPFGNATSTVFLRPLVYSINNKLDNIFFAKNTLDQIFFQVDTFGYKSTFNRADFFGIANFYNQIYAYDTPNSLVSYGNILASGTNSGLGVRLEPNSSYPMRVGTDAEFTQDVKVANLEVSGSYKGKVYNSHLARISATAGSYSAFEFFNRSSTAWGYPTLSDMATFGVGHREVLPCLYDGNIKKILLRNHNNTVSQTVDIRVYKVSSGDDVSDSSNYTTIYSSSSNISTEESKAFLPPSGNFSAGDLLIFALINLANGCTYTSNIMLEYTVS